MELDMTMTVNIKLDNCILLVYYQHLTNGQHRVENHWVYYKTMSNKCFSLIT